MGNAHSVGHLSSLSFVYLYFLFISQFGFKSGIWLLIAPVSVHCYSITSNKYPHSMVQSKNKKKMYTPVNPRFTI